MTPEVAGKPAPPLLEETIRRVGGSRPLMVGDRLDTDIEGGRRAEVDSLLVLTGVTGLADLVAAGPELRPTYVAADLGGLLEVHHAPERRDEGWRAGGWTARVDAAGLVVDGDGSRRRLVARRGPGRLGAPGRGGRACGHRRPAPACRPPPTGSLGAMSQTEPETPEPVRTGVSEVDAVLDSVEALDDRPVEEHPAVFEAAHEQLRRSLDGTG